MLLRQHTYAARALIAMMVEDGEAPPPLTELEQDFPRVIELIKQHAHHHERHAGTIDMLRTLGHWSDGQL